MAFIRDFLYFYENTFLRNITEIILFRIFLNESPEKQNPRCCGRRSEIAG